MKGHETCEAQNRLLREQLTRMERAQAELRKLASAVEHSPISVMITDPTGRIEYVNPKFCQVTGYTPEEVLGMNPRILRGDALPRETYRDLWQTILSGREWHGEFLNRNKDGSLIWELASISPVCDDSGAITHFVGVKEDINELKTLQQRLGELAHSDELTGLPNRALFFDRLEQVIIQSRRSHKRFALLFVDLDGFKGINDSHGHLVGDELLRAAASRLTHCVRESNTVARLGGDEFVVILTEVTHWEDPGVVAARVLQDFSAPFTVGTIVCRIGVSIGISIFPDDADNVQELIACADSAMYQVKQSGRNSFRYRSGGPARAGTADRRHVERRGSERRAK